MIELREITKYYKTASFSQEALDHVSLKFRNNEFVAILGPSGAGKTTLLNVIGGLDHADSGSIINGVSTSDYKSSDWDTYRNHRIGFVFQSYNLIPHQTVLSNVELALTLSGVPKAERRERAKKALEHVGLGDHVDKLPSQLSGGQMQRVAIARALVNNPDIVLADEPTGALDSETGVQVMNVLADVARDRLVIMVTHNADLAEEYATRIIRLKDGKIQGDSNPITPDEAQGSDGTQVMGATRSPGEASDSSEARSSSEQKVFAAPVASDSDHDSSRGSDRTTSKREKKASMSFLTALSLSFRNLMTKKGRTFLTAFAGSIGIMGIAAILALSTGVNNYIAKTEEDTLSSYPLSIQRTNYDMSSMLGLGEEGSGSEPASDSDQDAATAVDQADSIPQKSMVSDMFAQVQNNDLGSFKSYLEGDGSYVNDYVNAIRYAYPITPQIYSADTSNGVEQLNPGVVQRMTRSQFSESQDSSSGSGMGSSGGYSEMLNAPSILDSQFDVVDGRWPEDWNECVLVLDRQGRISDYTLYSLGVLNPNDLEQSASDAIAGKSVQAPENDVDSTYEDALNMTLKVVNRCDMYSYNADHNTWTDMSNDQDFMRNAVQNASDLKIVGVVRPNATTESPALSQGIAYDHRLIDHLMEQAANSDIVKQQQANPDVDVFTGQTFDEMRNQDNQFDMSNIISVDEGAMQNAFQFDEDALTQGLDGSGADGMDMSALGGDMAGDLSGMDLSGLDMGNIDMQSLFSNAPTPDLSQISSSPLTESQQSQIAEIQTRLVSGFLPYWYTQHPGESIDRTTDLTSDLTGYLQTDEAQSLMRDAAAITGQATQASVQDYMNTYMTQQFEPYMQQVMQQSVTQAAQSMATQIQSQIAQQMQAASATAQLAAAAQMAQISQNMQNAISFDPDAFTNAIQFNMTQQDLMSMLSGYANASSVSLDNNLQQMGYADPNNPQSIDLYPKDFANKQNVLDVIDTYNQQMRDEGQDGKVISYSDIVGQMMQSVTDIVNMVSLVLIAFVSISLVVSSIMIGIITYISVLERKKEIGILRAMGASKRNVANVFNAETFIEGLISGVFAIIVVYIASIPVNAAVLSIYNVENVMSLSPLAALALIGISVLLTFIAGLIPSQAAARRDPVEALRSE